MKIYNLTRYRGIAIIISVVLIAGFWAGTFLQGGFNFGIDFRAGLNLTIEISGSPDLVDVKDALSPVGNVQVQTIGDEGNTFIIRVAEDETIADFRGVITDEIGDRIQAEFGSYDLLSEEYVGARFAGTLSSRTVLLVVVALALILVYIWIRFRLNYAVSSIIAIFHDVLFLAGFIGLLQLEFTTATIAALLTIIGYSLNDTIVIFDRVRENTRIVKDKSFQEVVDLSVSQSLSRTLITSLTTLLAVVAIFIFGIGAIRTFALSLIVGVVVGTYSSIFIASPILLAWHNAEARKARRSVQASSRGKDPGKPKTDDDNEKVIAFRKPDEDHDPVRQTAEEIAEATARKAKAKAKKKKKKK